MWQLILSAPFFRSLELAVPDEDGVHALKFPCQRSSTGRIPFRSACFCLAYPLARLD